MDRVHHIVELLHKYKSGKMTTEEQMELEAWFGKVDHRLWMEKMLSEENETEILRAFEHYDADKAYRKFCMDRSGRKLYLCWVWSAAIVLPLILSIGWFVKIEWHKPDLPVVMENRIQAGNSKAVLTLSSGQTVILGKERPVYIQEEKGVFMKADSVNLVYERKTEIPVELRYNELTVPRKGEYSLQLSDGTKVHLNSESWLKYPETFGKERREVELVGEAYFEVQRDTMCPFIVKVGEMKVQVLGTVFNINAYKEKAEIKTTLVAGKVKVECSGKAVELFPGEQACVKTTTDYIHKEKVDVALYTAWKDGLFKFERESLENIMMVLGRWYDVTVFFQNNALRESLFTGDLKKYDSIEEHLRMLELTTNVGFQIHGNIILVGYKK